MVVKQVSEELLHEAVEELFAMISFARAVFKAMAEWRTRAAIKISNTDFMDFMIMDLSSMACIPVCVRKYLNRARKSKENSMLGHRGTRPPELKG